MIGLALRLTVNGGREALARLLVIVLAVTIGVGLLLATLAGINAVNAQNGRYAWLETGYTPDTRAAGASSAVDPAWWRLSSDTFDGLQIGRVDVAATGPTSPVPPGIPQLPGPGEYYASPAMSALLRSTPYAELGARYGGRQVGTIGAASTPSPDSLFIIIGHRPAGLAHSGADRVTSIATTSPDHCAGCAIGVGINSNGMHLVLGVVMLAVLFPVLIFIGAATRLSAARREQRFAAMRLVGATPRQISLISTVESGVAAVAGVALGFPLFFLVRPAIAQIPFTGASFYTGDLSLSLVDVLAVALGVPVAAAIAARVALRRVQISPLGVSRRATPRPPRAWRLLPLLAGIAELAWFAAHGAPTGTPAQTEAYFTGFALTLVGLVLAGPWLTMAGSRLLARRAGRPAGLIAARRLADDPKAGFRAVAGLVVALFVTSVTVGVITTLVAYSGGTGSTSSSDARTLYQTYFSARDTTRPTDTVPELPTGLRGDLAAIPGVTGFGVIHQRNRPNPRDLVNGMPQDYVVCAQLARLQTVGRCVTGARTALIAGYLGSNFGTESQISDRVWPASPLTVGQVDALPVHALVVATDGSTDAIESARTALEHAFFSPFAPATLSAMSSDKSRLLNAYQQLANVVILVSLPIAGCSLAVSVAGGLNERKRPFSLLRLTGVPLGMLRRVLTLETALPLLVTAALAVGTGFLSAQLFLRAQLDETLQAPGLQYYLIVVAGLIAALGVIASTLPVLRRITGPETARND